jgi:hypothetical protein
MRTTIEKTHIRISATLLLALTIVAVEPAAAAVRPCPDFNRDFVADLVVAAPDEDIGPAIDTGVVHIIYGRNMLGLGPANQRIHAGGITLAAGQSGDQSGLHFGQALAWGDFKGDGFDDLAVGMPGYDAGPFPNVGMVYVLYGSPQGLQIVGVQYFVSTNLGPPLNVNMDPNDFFGAVLAAGDFNGDGFDDLAIGAPGQDGWDGAAVIPDAGEVYVVYGSQNRLQHGSAQGWSQNGRTIWPDIGYTPGGRPFWRVPGCGQFQRRPL